MASARGGLAKELLKASMEFRKLELWEVYEANEGVALELPTEDGPVFALVMGQAGEEFGLALYRGEGALYRVRESMARDAMDEDNLQAASLMGITFDRLRDTPPELRGVLKEAGYQGRRNDIVPCFMVKPPSRYARDPNQTERRTLLYILRALISGHRDGLLDMRDLNSDELQTLRITGFPGAPEMTFEIVTYAAKAEDGGARTLEFLDLAGYPRLQETWVVGMPVMPARIAGDDRILRAALIVVEEEERILKAKPVKGDDIRAAAATVREAIEGESDSGQCGVPKRMTFTYQGLFDHLAPALRAGGIACSFEKHVPLMDDLAAELASGMSGEEEDLSIDPEPGDLDSWKAADMALCEVLGAQIPAKRWETPRARKRYFGDARNGQRLLCEREEEGVRPAFFDWLVFDYRATKRSRPHAENMLAGELPPVWRKLLKARLAAAPSLWRITDVESPPELTLVDLLTGERRVVTDRALSESAPTDVCLVARVYQAGDFHFLMTVGPAMSVMKIDRAMEHLESLGMELSHEGMKEKAHLLGHLWQWLEEAPGFPAKLQNTDGEELVLQEARFRVDDPRALRRALKRRKDIDEDDEFYAWTGTAGLGKNTLLGRLVIKGSVLKLEVNSRERLERARRWLEKIPGVKFQRVDESEMDPQEMAAQAGMRSNPEPMELTPEGIGAIEEYLHEHYMRWLDEPIPALGNKTPRQACRTKSGRKHVLRLIRTMPQVGPPGMNVKLPVAEMMRSLGFEAES